MDGYSHQYCGSSVVELFANTKGGAVILLRSPLIVAIEARNSFNVDLFAEMELIVDNDNGGEEAESCK